MKREVGGAGQQLCLLFWLPVGVIFAGDSQLSLPYGHPLTVLLECIQLFVSFDQAGPSCQGCGEIWRAVSWRGWLNPGLFMHVGV